MHVLAAVAQFERSVIRERINAGLRQRVNIEREVVNHLGARARCISIATL